jgi:hypothetical protein
MAKYTKTLVVLAAGAALVLAVVIAIGFFGSSTKPKTSDAEIRAAPRAQLVSHSVPRAQLVALPPAWPPLFVGGRYLATMPYDNLEVLATLRGGLPSQDDLPSHRNAIGDMYLVGNVPFVWLFPPGASRADWIEP